MLFHEFKERTGLEITEEEFGHINGIYMSCGDEISNPEFCNSYKHVHGNAVLEGLYKEYLRRETEIARLKDSFKKMERAYLEMVRKYESGSSRRYAVKAYSNEGEYIKAMLAAGLDLEPADRDYLIHTL